MSDAEKKAFEDDIVLNQCGIGVTYGGTPSILGVKHTQFHVVGLLFQSSNPLYSGRC